MFQSISVSLFPPLSSVELLAASLTELNCSLHHLSFLSIVCVMRRACSFAICAILVVNSSVGFSLCPPRLFRPAPPSHRPTDLRPPPERGLQAASPSKLLSALLDPCRFMTEVRCNHLRPSAPSAAARPPTSDLWPESLRFCRSLRLNPCPTPHLRHLRPNWSPVVLNIASFVIRHSEPPSDPQAVLRPIAQQDTVESRLR
jgi:hypothetical protein